MAWVGRAPRRRVERGVALVEYALVLALFVGASAGAIRYLEDRTGDEVDNQAECISQRPPPTTCQIPAATPSGDPVNPGGPGDPGGGGPPSSSVADISAPSVSAGPPGTPAGTTYDIEVTYAITDDSVPTPEPITGEIVTAQVVVTQSSAAHRIGEFFYVECVTDSSGTCTFEFDSRWGDVDEITIRIVAVGIDTPYDFPDQPASPVGRP